MLAVVDRNLAMVMLVLGLMDVPIFFANSLNDVGTSFSQPILNNNFASLAAKVDALIVALQRHGLMES